MTTLATVFEEHSAPTHCGRSDVHSQLAPILKVGSEAQKQILEYRSLLMQEELNGDPALDPKLEHVHQTLGALEREATALVAAGRALGKAFTQLDRYLAEVKADLAASASTPTDGAQATK